jgi:signal peptidase I
MIGSVERMAPSRRRRERPGWRMVVRVAVFVFLGWALAAQFLVSTWQVGSVSMSPALAPADRVATSPIPFGPWVPLTALRLPGLREPKRGDLVVVEPPYAVELAGWRRLAEPVVEFFSFQRGTLARTIDGARADRFVVKRVIGVPGDTIRLEGFKAMIRPRGTGAYVPEDQLMTRRFIRRIDLAAASADPSPTFTGNSAEVTLGDGQYFLLGDNRTSSSDSRSWGAVRLDRIRALVLFRYWPLSSIGGA